MALYEQYPGAGITTITGRQGSPIANTEVQSYPQGFEQAEQPLGTQSVEDTIISLYRTNTPIDVISQQVGVPSDHVVAVINEHQQTPSQFTPSAAPPGVETEFEQETITDLPFEQIDTEQITTSPDLLSDGLGTQALMAMDPSITANSPEAGEARNLEQKIMRTGTTVYGLNTEDPDVIQTGNVLSLDVLDGLQDDEEGISDDVKNQVLQDIGLNDVFTNENISMEDRIDFFKHYIAETLGLDYDDLKKSPDE